MTAESTAESIEIADDDLVTLDADLELDEAAEGRDLAVALPWRGFRHTNGYLFTTMLLSALLSLTAAVVLSIDAWILAADPTKELACDINAVLSCGSVALSDQATLFGFPNSFLGLIFEPVVITLAIASLGGTRFPRWFMATAQFIYLLALIFALWLFFQSTYVIHALCPWCLVITFGTTMVFMTLLHVNIRDNNLYLPRGLQRKAESALRMNLDLLMTFLMIAAITAIILVNYGTAIFGV
ncbi:Uncharacterized membrane protein [Micrococcales bacterium KH10]|nr:Uncharacterized membrane protein [Micrococcales bacterium KH10]